MLAASVLVLSACGGGGGSGARPPAPASDATIVHTPTPASAARTAGAVWVLSPVGLRVHTDHSTAAQTLFTASRGVQLDILGTATDSDGAWLRVRSHEGTTEGWVKDDPDLVSRTSMAFYSDSVNGWSMLYPADWQAQPGNPATISGGGRRLTVQFAADPNALLAVPGAPGHAVRDEGPVEAYGVTVFFSVYALDRGGYEYDARVRVSPSKVYGFQMSDPSKTADTVLFRQMLDSTVLT